jgi:hypothetical protein
MMIKKNVVESARTPAHELKRKDDSWDKEAAALFKPRESKVVKQPDKKVGG